MRFLNLEYFFVKVYELFTGKYTGESPTTYFNEQILPTLQMVSLIVSLTALVVLIYSLIRWREIIVSENLKYAFVTTQKGDPERNERWVHITDLLDSESPNDWRQAIIEADIILDDLVTKMGYRGESLGEKLKTIEKADFKTLDNAWEAHKFRNRIAHEGRDFVVTQREGRRIIDLFRTVFEEFGYISSR